MKKIIQISLTLSVYGCLLCIIGMLVIALLENGDHEYIMYGSQALLGFMTSFLVLFYIYDDVLKHKKDE